MPKRIQLRRQKGWRMPEGAVLVSRPSKWGNPFVPRDKSSEERALCVRQFKESVERALFAITVADVRAELRGKDLACWCPLELACHADVLLEIANRETIRCFNCGVITPVVWAAHGSAPIMPDGWSYTNRDGALCPGHKEAA